MATDIPRIHKWWQQPSPNNDYRPPLPQPWPCELRNSLLIAMQCKRFVCNTQTQAHGWLDGRTNAWNDNNTHRHQCWPRVSHLETSAFLTLCHSFPVTCQQMCKNLKMWLTDLLTDKRTDRWTDKRVAGGHYCWGVLLWPPQLGLGGKCDKKWKFKNVEKITSFSDAVTLTFDLRPWKVNQVRTLSLPMCIPNLRTIHPVVFELSR